ncbi:putative organic solvent tolerance protein [Moraxella macacae 0408225]|uniref:LPS-assembly protein LptD n=1 Tax=Moraxella macacae 0408225 TaxID=1230338 RepID=L2F7P3_9GAMM|nr:LPS assembly protein LptD [Moraxella macacae]ELA08488.1 putative organic solvent tolerance protein [Moraxella macacae 0408225]
MIKNYQHCFVALAGFMLSPVVYAENLSTNVDLMEENLSIDGTQTDEANINEANIDETQIEVKSARTHQNFTANTARQQSLERLKQYYKINQATNHNQSNKQAQPNKQAEKLAGFGKNLTNNLLGKTQKAAVCQGAWTHLLPNTDVAKGDSRTQDSQNSLSNDTTLYAKADYGYYNNESYAEFVGDVQISQGLQQLNADKVAVNLKDGIALAQGNVTMLQNNQTQNNQTQSNHSDDTTTNSDLGLISVADEVAYQSDFSKAVAKEVAFASVSLQAHGYAKQLHKVDDTHYEIDDVMFTLCPPENPTWQINAKNLDINTDTGRAQVYNAAFKIKDKALFYLPYFNFPIDDRRTSGFLLPKFGFSNDGGLAVQTPYYVNLAPNYDMTLTPNIFSNRNPMLTGELRYLSASFGQGDLTGTFLPHDKKYNGEDRKSLFYQHHWQSKKYPTLSANAVYQYVSDSAYFDDFDTLGMEHIQLNLPRRIQANYHNDYLTALAKVETFQTLDNKLTYRQDILDKDRPYQRLPQLSMQYRLPFFKHIDVQGVSDFAYFKRPIDDNSAVEQSGGRLYNKISASYPLKRTWGYMTPTLSLQHLYTQYDKQTTLANNFAKDDKIRSIFVPEFSLDMGLNFYKSGSPFAQLDNKKLDNKKLNSTKGGYQLISPRLKYVYSPYKDQSDVPNFNTRLASLNFPQLYENSWFFGYDRLADNNHITPSVNYRYIDANGLTRLDASIGQQFYLDKIRVHLADHNRPLAVKSSGTVLQINAQPYQDVWLDLDGAVNAKGDLHYYNAQLRYQPNNNALYNLGMVKRKPHPMGQQALTALTVAAVVPISQNWGFLTAVQYDNLKNRYSDVLAGVTYESCCYGFSLYGRSYYNELDNDNKPKRAIMAQLSLNGIFNKRYGKLSSMINDRVQGFNQLNRF